MARIAGNKDVPSFSGYQESEPTTASSGNNKQEVEGLVRQIQQLKTDLEDQTRELS